MLIFIAAVFFSLALNTSKVLAILGTVISAMMPVLAGLAVAFILNVPMSFLERKVFAFMDKSKFRAVRVAKKPICIALALIFVLLIIGLVLLIVLPELIEAIKSITSNFSSYAKTVPDWVVKTFKEFGLSEKTIEELQIDIATLFERMATYLKDTVLVLLSKTVSITTSIVSGVFSGALSLVVAIYALACKKRMLNFANRLLDNFASDTFAKRVRLTLSIANNSFSKFIAGQALENVLLGVMCYIGMTLFRFPYAAAVSVLVGVAQTIPIVGSIVSATVGTLLMLTDSPLTALFFLVFVVVIQQIEGNVIYPKVVGKKVGLPGIGVIFAVIVGGNLFGILGVLIGIPLTSTVYAIIKVLMDEAEKKRAEREITAENGDEAK